jgi:hypothetical protein
LNPKKHGYSASHPGNYPERLKGQFSGQLVNQGEKNFLQLNFNKIKNLRQVLFAPGLGLESPLLAGQARYHPPACAAFKRRGMCPTSPRQIYLLLGKAVFSAL